MSVTINQLRQLWHMPLMLSLLFTDQRKIMNDIKELEDSIDALALTAANLREDVFESKKTLLALVDLVIAIRSDMARTDIQLAINTLQAKALAIKSDLSNTGSELRAAEDAADDVFEPEVVGDDVPVGVDVAPAPEQPVGEEPVV